MNRNDLAYYSGRGKAELIMVSDRDPEQIERNLKDYLNNEIAFNVNLNSVYPEEESYWLEGMKDAFKDRGYYNAATTVAEFSDNIGKGEIYQQIEALQK